MAADNMAGRTSTARRYAEAAFEIAERDKTTDDAGLPSSIDCRAALSPTRSSCTGSRTRDVPLEKRTATVFKALFADGQMLPQVGNLLGLILRRRRLEIVPQVAREFRRLYNRRAGIDEATATSAAELDAHEVPALRARLEKMTGGKVELTTAGRPAASSAASRSASATCSIDGSVRGRLERLRAKLASGASTA